MKRRWLIWLISSLLLCIQGPLCLAEKHKPPPPRLKTVNLKFYYKLDEKARLIDLKVRHQTEQPGQLTWKTLASLAEAADKAASVEAELPAWRYQGGPSPQIFTAKLHFYNPGKNALSDIPMTVTVKAQLGDLRVSPLTQLTDYTHLQKTARWETISIQRRMIPIIAPGEDQLVEVARINLPDLLSKHPNRWPAAIRVSVSSPLLGIAERELPLFPDHFAIPELY
ncbi:MAG TPA: hypothetical protein V6C99_11415 [Oculatellaceae cyanobacterium]